MIVGIDPGQRTGFAVLIGGAIKALYTVSPDVVALIPKRDFRLRCRMDGQEQPTHARRGDGGVAVSEDGEAMKKKRRPYTWADIYYRHIRAGDDQSYAAWAADRWEQRQKRKKKPLDAGRSKS